MTPSRFRQLLEAEEDLVVAVDLDGTLAFDDGWKGIEHIGEPIPAMLQHVKGLMAQGENVVIFTARAHEQEAVPYVEAWCEKHLGAKLPVTNQKVPLMKQFIDDKAVAVEKNKGTMRSFADDDDNAGNAAAQGRAGAPVPR